MQLPHLKMLSKVFAVNGKAWSDASRDTNGVERVNEENKNSALLCLTKAMEKLYKKDKMVALSYIAAERSISLQYGSRNDEARPQIAVSRKRQHLQNACSDKDAEFGPPD